MCITSISTAPKIDYLPDIIGSKTKRVMAHLQLSQSHIRKIIMAVERMTNITATASWKLCLA